MHKILILVLFTTMLLACGIKGDLYLPPEPEASEPEANEASA